MLFSKLGGQVDQFLSNVEEKLYIKLFRERYTYLFAVVWRLQQQLNAAVELCSKHEKLIQHLRHDKRVLNATIEESASLKGSLKTFKKKWLDHHIQNISRNTYAGSCDSWLKQQWLLRNKQRYVDHFIKNNTNDLTIDDIRYIKVKTTYLENFEAYHEIDPDTGKKISLDELMAKEERKAPRG